jgi:hypothetical protein
MSRSSNVSANPERLPCSWPGMKFESIFIEEEEQNWLISRFFPCLFFRKKSSMAGYALGGKDAQRYDSLVDAARNGRRGKECHELYPKCPARNDSSAVPALLNLASRLIKN